LLQHLLPSLLLQRQPAAGLLQLFITSRVLRWYPNRF
jgi:hypothetical protein